MAELLEAVVSWSSLLLVLLVFGFAPGFCLRLIVVAYPRDDSRRTELIAELYAVPRIQRPLWVAEQLETALFEGLPHRLAAARRWAACPHRAHARGEFGAGFWAGHTVGLVAASWTNFGIGFWALLGVGLVAGSGGGILAMYGAAHSAVLGAERLAALGVALGTGLGAALGVVFEEAGLVAGLGIALGTVLGVALGVRFWTALGRCSK